MSDRTKKRATYVAADPHLAACVRRLRLQCGLTQDQMAQACKWPLKRYARCESGQPLHVADMQAIEDAAVGLGVAERGVLLRMVGYLSRPDLAGVIRSEDRIPPLVRRSLLAVAAPYLDDVDGVAEAS